MKKIILLLSITFGFFYSLYAQEPLNAYIGKLVMSRNPCPELPCLPGMVLWLETTTLDYVLTISSQWIWDDTIIFDDIVYQENDEVEIIGTVTIWNEMETYYELEIETIKKLTSNIESVSTINNNVYYDATSQMIMINGTLHNQSLTFELVNMQGEVMLKKAGISNNDSISAANLLSGVYLYRVMQNERAINVGKLLITN